MKNTSSKNNFIAAFGIYSISATVWATALVQCTKASSVAGFIGVSIIFSFYILYNVNVLVKDAKNVYLVGHVCALASLQLFATLHFGLSAFSKTLLINGLISIEIVIGYLFISVTLR